MAPIGPRIVEPVIIAAKKVVSPTTPAAILKEAAAMPAGLLSLMAISRPQMFRPIDRVSVIGPRTSKTDAPFNHLPALAKALPTLLVRENLLTSAFSAFFNARLAPRIACLSTTSLPALAASSDTRPL